MSTRYAHPAEYAFKRADGRWECRLCPHHCVLREGQVGICHVRVATAGGLVAAGYGHISSSHIDPMEKKPLYHFHPGEPIFSLGGWGCNFGCAFCQNWTISQAAELRGVPSTAADIVKSALGSGCRWVAYTYNEPLVGFEFVRDCSRLVREAGAGNVLVTNGFVEEAPAAELLPLTDALNVDIKSMDESFYRRQCRGRLAPVLRFCRQAVAAGCHVEITNLIIPALNDAPGQIEQLAVWIRDNLGAATPLHLSAYHPDYKSSAEATPPEILLQAHDICRRHLAYVYLGNIRTTRGQDTICPGCGHTWVSRRGYEVTVPGLRDGVCAKCGRKSDVVTRSR